MLHNITGDSLIKCMDKFIPHLVTQSKTESLVDYFNMHVNELVSTNTSRDTTVNELHELSIHVIDNLCQDYMENLFLKITEKVIDYNFIKNLSDIHHFSLSDFQYTVASALEDMYLLQLLHKYIGLKQAHIQAIIQLSMKNGSGTIREILCKYINTLIEHGGEIDPKQVFSMIKEAYKSPSFDDGNPSCPFHSEDGNKDWYKEVNKIILDEMIPAIKETYGNKSNSLYTAFYTGELSFKHNTEKDTFTLNNK